MDFKDIRFETLRQLNRTALHGQIVLAGSSLCEGFPVNEMLINRGIGTVVYNRGISGDTIAGYSARFDDCVLAIEPKKLFINIGTNDLNGPEPDIPLLIAGYEKVLTHAMEKLPDMKVYVLSYYPINEKKHYSMPYHSQRTNKCIRLANDALREMASRLSLPYIDVNAGLLDADGELREELTFDGMHMYPSGYEPVLDVLLPYFA